MAIAVKGGHIKRAIDFYNSRENMYFIIGGTQPWTDENGQITESAPDENSTEFNVRGLLGLKKIDDIALVRPLRSEESSKDNDIVYKNIRYRRLDPGSINVIVPLSQDVGAGSTTITLGDIASNHFNVGDRVRIDDKYEATIVSMTGQSITVDTPAPERIWYPGYVSKGAYVEGTNYVYVSCDLSYDDFPTGTYRQIGLCTGVVGNYQNNQDIYNNEDEVMSIGVLEVLDNRAPNTRVDTQREHISLIIEF